MRKAVSLEHNQLKGILMSLREGDLVHTVLKKISIDEFEPKTGKTKAVMVLGLYVTEKSAGDDLYHYLNGSAIDIRDVEVSPNPNDDGYHMVFVELDRNQKVFDNVKSLIKDVERLSGKLSWQVKTHLIDDYMSLNDPNLTQYVITDPKKYVTRQQFDEIQTQREQQQKAERAAARQAKQQRNDQMNESLWQFLKPSNLLKVSLEEGALNLHDARGALNLKFVAFGPGSMLMQKYGISESAIKMDFDRTLFHKLGSMLGEMKALPIQEYVVIYNPADQTNVLITQPT